VILPRRIDLGDHLVGDDGPVAVEVDLGRVGDQRIAPPAEPSGHVHRGGDDRAVAPLFLVQLT
jgi:hypothetical protein